MFIYYICKISIYMYTLPQIVRKNKIIEPGIILIWIIAILVLPCIIFNFVNINQCNNPTTSNILYSMKMFLISTACIMIVELILTIVARSIKNSYFLLIFLICMIIIFCWNIIIVCLIINKQLYIECTTNIQSYGIVNMVVSFTVNLITIAIIIYKYINNKKRDFYKY